MGLLSAWSASRSRPGEERPGSGPAPRTPGTLRLGLALPGAAVRAALAAAVLAAACGRAGEGAGGDPFPGSAPTLEALGEHVLRALVRGDTAALQAVRLTEWEHNRVVWPELPASAPEIDFPVDFAWENIQMRNRRALARILPRYRGRDLEPQAVRCLGERRTFATFHVLTDCRVRFLAGDGAELEAGLFKDVLVRGGGHKIFRYYDGPLEPASDASTGASTFRSGRRSGAAPPGSRPPPG